MCIGVLVLAPSGWLDWELAEPAISALPEEMLGVLADDFGYDTDTDDDTRVRLREAVAATRDAIEGWNRECTTLRYGTTTFWLTGGVSSDSPTDLFDDFCLLDRSGIAQAIGFSWPADPPDTAAADTTGHEGGQ